MRFRTQMLLAFVPLFLLLGASGETVLALLEHREMRWGLEEEASSLAVALAEFLRDQPFTNPHPPAAGAINWEDSVGTVLKRDQVLRLDLLAADGRTVVRHFGPAAPAGTDAALPPGVAERLGRETWVLGAIAGRGSDATLTAYAPLHRPDGALAGYLGVTVDAGDYLLASKLETQRIGYGAGASLLAGLLAIGLVVRPVTRGTRELRAAADRAQTGETLTPPAARLVQETDDLGETFGTMSTLLGEAMDKTRQNLVENEQLRTSQDLAAAFHARFSQPLHVRHGAVEAEARIVGADPGGAFCTCRRIGDTLWAFTGQVEVSDKLQQAVVASAARGYLEDALSRMAPEAAVTEIAAVLPLTNWTCLGWPLDGGTPPRRWTGKGRRLTAPSAAVEITGPLCLHTFGPDRQHTIDTCLGGFDGLPAADIAENIRRLLGDAARGALVVLRYAPVAATPPAAP